MNIIEELTKTLGETYFNLRIAEGRITTMEKNIEELEAENEALRNFKDRHSEHHG